MTELREMVRISSSQEEYEDENVLKITDAFFLMIWGMKSIFLEKKNEWIFFYENFLDKNSFANFRKLFSHRKNFFHVKFGQR